MSSNTNRKQGLAWVGIIAVLGVTMWFGWKAMRDAKPEEAGGAAGGGRPPSTVIFKPAETKEMVEFLSVTGTLRALRRADVAAREAAAVESMAVNEGDLVEAGAVLATLDGRRLDAQLAEAEASLTASKAELSATRRAQFISATWPRSRTTGRSRPRGCARGACAAPFSITSFNAGRICWRR